MEPKLFLSWPQIRIATPTQASAPAPAQDKDTLKKNIFTWLKKDYCKNLHKFLQRLWFFLQNFFTSVINKKEPTPELEPEPQFEISDLAPGVSLISAPRLRLHISDSWLKYLPSFDIMYLRMYHTTPIWTLLSRRRWGDWSETSGRRLTGTWRAWESLPWPPWSTPSPPSPPHSQATRPTHYRTQLVVVSSR